MKLKLKRFWINQPSTLQPDHGYHGKNVLAYPAPDEKITDVYFTEVNGPISARMFVSSLSPGWK